MNRFPLRSRGLRRLVLAAALAAAGASQASGEYITEVNGPGGFGGQPGCNDAHAFNSGGSERFLDVYGLKTTVAAWGHGMDFASAVTSSNSSHVRARLAGKHGGAENGDAGCPRVGSIDLEFNPGSSFSSSATANVTTSFPVGNPWVLPVKMWPLRGAISWAPNLELRDCLRRQGGDLIRQTLNPARANDHLRIEIPRGYDTRACAAQIGIAAGLEANEFIDASPDSTTWSTVMDRGPATAGQVERLRTCTRGACSATLLINLDENAAAALPHPSMREIRVHVQFGGKMLETLAADLVTVDRQNQANAAPLPSFTAAPASGAPPLNVAFDARASRDPDGNIARFDWAFGDGQRGAGPQLNHSYTTAGLFTATLTVTDNAGRTASAQRQIDTRAAAPPPPPPQPSINLLPQLGTLPLPPMLRPNGTFRRIDGTFCAGVPADQDGVATVREFRWGVSAVNRSPGAPVTVELRDTGDALAGRPPRLLATFAANNVQANSAAVTQANYPGRPATVRVTNVSSGLASQFGGVVGCYLARDTQPVLDPPFNQLMIVVDPVTPAQPRGAFDEGDRENDNEQRF